jgi:magnesium-transporting ATPase (P-type)
VKLICLFRKQSRLDNPKKIILHLGTRIGVLALLLGLVFLIWYFGPSHFSVEKGDKHNAGALAMVMIISVIVLIFNIVLFIEMVDLFLRKNKILAFTNLGFLIISLYIISVYMFPNILN